MSRSTANMRDLAKRLVAHEAMGKRPFERSARTFVGVIEKVRGPLVALTGVAGFRSLLSRALALANAEVRWLRAVHVKTDGALECPAEIAQLDKEEIANGEVALLAQLLGLLVTFIGEALTARLLEDVWPGVPVSDFVFERKSPGKEQK
jgi:hypothetical protein